MKTRKETLNNLVMSLCEIVIGVLLLINPIGYTTGILIVLGVVLALAGLVSVIAYFRQPPEEAVLGHQLSIGLIEITVGLFCALRAKWLIATVPVLILLYGVILLVTGFVKIQWAIDLFRLKRGPWFVPLISAALAFLAAAIIFMNPLTTTAFLWTYTAITLIVEAVVDIISVIFRGRKRREG